MDDLVAHLAAYQGRRVLVTGDTGFKGSWLALWLQQLGADVFGYALPALSERDHFAMAKLNGVITHEDGDIRDLDHLQQFFDRTRPEFVFHLAAQSLVRRSYADPRDTFATNVSGSVNVLECVRRDAGVKALIYVTSDKCYDNREWVWGYRETDRLGGADPYSASKAAAEIVFDAYHRSFFQHRDGCGVASVRAGNVIGGGDWAEDRIVPDCIRALADSRPIVLRKPHATRPWQHVLEPLSGYLLLGSKLANNAARFSGAWNFGPRTDSSRSVQELAGHVIDVWGGGSLEIAPSPADPHEAGLLHLNCDKAELLLDWKPRWRFARTVRETVSWYSAVLAGASAAGVSRSQIQAYTESPHD